MSSFTLLISFWVIFVLCSLENVFPNCIIQDGKYDLSSLEVPGGWHVVHKDTNGTLKHYILNVCSSTYTIPIVGCTNSFVCEISGNVTTSYGDALVDGGKNYTVASLMQNGFSVFRHTNTSCSDGSIYRSTISFSCGPNLGTPELFLLSKCQVNFYWKTSVACLVKPKQHQVPCYVLDEKSEKRDLSHLIKRTGGYFVTNPDLAFDFIINVCSDISPDNYTRNCPDDSSACRIAGSESLNFGRPQSALQYTKEGLLLTYVTTGVYNRYPAGCILEPKTTVLFKCPQRGHSQPPKVISNLNCQFDLEWETEYACPQSMLMANIKTCQFITEVHGIEIDLSPLKEKDVYTVASNSTKGIQFALSVCGGLKNFTCGAAIHWNFISACMIDTINKSALVVGKTPGSELMYADDEVMLTYPKGSMCENGIEHSTVINFVCDPLADNNGTGYPQHVSSAYCVHFFEWRTKHACLKQPLDTPCYVTFQKKKINLQRLFLVEGQPWLAVDRTNVGSAEYFINVCGQVSGLGNLSSCGASSSACALHRDGSFLNLGNFTSPPIYDSATKSVRLDYIGGSPCRGQVSWHSKLNFVCRPGHISELVLTRINDSNCVYEFEWHTAEACPEGTIEGSNCKVINNDLDINFDLRPLRSKVYQVDALHYRFYISVCESVRDTPCSKDRKETENIGVCLLDKLTNSTLKTGESSSKLYYMDGVVNLTYLSGDVENNTARMTLIIFICDYTAGNGNPTFVEQVDNAYVFHWFTNLVCLSATTTECLAQDPVSHQIYDLSGLSLSNENWLTFVLEDEEEEELWFYLNICRPLASPSSCDPKAAACIMKKNKIGQMEAVISNIGTATSGPVLESPGHLSITYDQGNPCIAFGKNVSYTTIIHFLCGEPVSKNGPIFLSHMGNCEYTFLWTTKAACPTENLQVTGSCQLTDSESGFTFDLTSLQKPRQPYSIETATAIYQLNICGRIMEGCTSSDGEVPAQNVTVCEVDKDGNKLSEIAVMEYYNLTYSVGQDLTLTYKSVAPEGEVIIKFPCSNSTIEQPIFLQHEDRRYIFEMKTTLTCIPSPTTCNFVDSKGNEYDLSPLARLNGNWEVVDFRPENMLIQYHINFCQPLNKDPSYICHLGASSACQTNSLEKESSGHDLGFQVSPPIVTDSGVVLVKYTNGSLCGNGQFQHSTVISLFCSREEGQLALIGVTPECQYLFSMDTPAACPLQSIQGSSCRVSDPVFGYVFDLNPLRSKNNNYNITVGSYKYNFNVCDKLNGFDNQCANSSACQTKPSDSTFSKSLGLPSDSLIYKKGIITLNYQSGSNCHGKYNRSTIITFTCHHEHEDRDGPTFISEADDCTYLFEWPTVHACPPFEVIECSVTDSNGIYYDLSPLSLPDDNYYIKNPFSDNKTFVINLCRSVVHTSNSLCPYTAAACLTNSVNSSESLNLGRVGKSPYVEDGKIKIKYTSGDPCDDEKTFSRFWQTIIEFRCDQNNLKNEPQFVGKDDCVYYFDWSTIYACHNKLITTSNCTAEDPKTGHIFNLTTLQTHGLFETQAGKHQYYINVCGNISTPCGTETGVCQQEMSGEHRTWKVGDPSSHLLFNGDVLYLNYTNGDLCHGGRFRRNTVIEFHCGPGMGEPKFLYEANNCTYLFKWTTNLACQTSLHCGIRNDSQYYDLSKLAGQAYHTASSSVLNDDALYFVSVCSDLPTYIGGFYCPPGSGICRVSKLSNNMSQSQNLGKVNGSPFVDFMGYGTALYTNGSSCETKENDLNRARILFLCDSEAGMSEPVLIEKMPSDCFYLFEWRTSLVCPEKPSNETVMACSYIDSSRGIHFDLSSLQKRDEPFLVDDDDGNRFLLKVCSPLGPGYQSNCKEAGVCGATGNTPSLSYGQAKSQHFTFDGRRLRLTFTRGDDCPAGHEGSQTSEIFFVCDPKAGSGTPVLHKKYTCLIVFMWKTSLVCQNMQRQCSFEVGGKHYDLNLLSSLSHNWEVTEGANKYLINLCRGVQRIPGCPNTAAVCLENSNNIQMALGIVQTMEVKPINSTDLLLTFQSGDGRACSGVQSSVTPVTRIFMRCGTKMGSPKKFAGPDSKCYYDFVWESSLACPDRAEQVILEKGGVIVDKRFDYTVNISDILNRTFNTVGRSSSDEYMYEINLSGVYHNTTENPCAKAAICQTKVLSGFFRDIGSFETRTFVVRGSELHLTFTSTTKPCGKNQSKNVTSIINMQCSSAAGRGKPKFVYESGDCDYVFEWETVAVCPEFHKNTDDNGKGGDPSPNPYKEESQSSHKAQIVVGIVVTILIVMAIAFAVMKPERRAFVSHRFRTLFGRVNFPNFRYKRQNGERLVLVDATLPHPYEDDRDLEMLT